VNEDDARDRLIGIGNRYCRSQLTVTRRSQREFLFRKGRFIDVRRRRPRIDVEDESFDDLFVELHRKFGPSVGERCLSADDIESLFLALVIDGRELIELPWDDDIRFPLLDEVVLRDALCEFRGRVVVRFVEGLCYERLQKVLCDCFQFRFRIVLLGVVSVSGASVWVSVSLVVPVVAGSSSL